MASSLLLSLSLSYRDIPSWKQRIAGKSIPMEKFAVKKCEQFFAQGKKLVLPAIELVYLWNGFKILGKKKELVKPILTLIENTRRTLSQSQGNNVRLTATQTYTHRTLPQPNHLCVKTVKYLRPLLYCDFD